MKKIVVAMEKTVTINDIFEVPDSVYEEIKRTNRIPDDMFDKMSETLDDTVGDTEYDYAVWSETEQKQLIEWEWK